MKRKDLVSPVVGQEYLMLISLLQNIIASFSPLRGSEILGDEQTTSQVSKLNTNDMRTNEMYRDRQKGLAVC